MVKTSVKRRGFMPRKPTKAAAKKAADAKSLSRVEKREVKRLIRGAGETKMVAWYYGSDNSYGSNAGALSQTAYIAQNNQIISNTTDILRLIPKVVEGTAENQRVGNRIQPVSFTVCGNIKASSGNIVYPDQTSTPLPPLDVRVVVFVLQHVSLKTYDSLKTQYSNSTPPVVIGGNDFNQLLSTGEGTTVVYDGAAWKRNMPVASEYYRLLRKQIVTLRYGGTRLVQNPASTPNPPAATVPVGIANCHTWNAAYSINLTKHLPKTLIYPESSVTTSSPDDPLNSSIFMCMGYERFDGAFNTVGSNPNPPLIDQTYQTFMKYKDL